MDTTPLLIIGSARHESQAGGFARRLLGGTAHATIDLLDLRIAPYDYRHAYPSDDQFAVVVEEMLRHPVLVLATPVYWYAMSAPMKTFFDRLTDLTETRKPAGRALRGRRVLLVATGSDEALPDGFTVPFERTAAYFGMQLQGSFYASTREPLSPAKQQEQARAFRELLLSGAGTGPG